MGVLVIGEKEGKVKGKSRHKEKEAKKKRRGSDKMSIENDKDPGNRYIHSGLVMYDSEIGTVQRRSV